MAQKVRINGTAYDLKPSPVLINGTKYQIRGGRTLINGTGYDIALNNKITISIIVTDGYSEYAGEFWYATINGTKYANPGDVFADAPTTITIYAGGNGTSKDSGVYKDGVRVADGKVYYSFEATTSCTIRFEVDGLFIVSCNCYITTS